MTIWRRVIRSRRLSGRYKAAFHDEFCGLAIEVTAISCNFG
jgi:hypothetical protein